MSISEQIGEFVYQTNYEDLPESVIKASKRCVLDWLAAGYKGSRDIASSWVLKMLYETCSKGSTFLTYPPIKGHFLFVAFSNAFFFSHFGDRRCS